VEHTYPRSLSKGEKGEHRLARLGLEANLMARPCWCMDWEDEMAWEVEARVMGCFQRHPLRERCCLLEPRKR
jgi:hypothetical protein